MPKVRHEPLRTCVACRMEAGKDELLRVHRDPQGLIRLDLSGRAPGRGAYLHHDAGCVETARRRRSLERALKAQPAPDLWERLSQGVGS